MSEESLCEIFGGGRLGLTLFLLVVDQTVNRDRENFGGRTLPNLEKQCVTADTLIKIEKRAVQEDLAPYPMPHAPTPSTPRNFSGVGPKPQHAKTPTRQNPNTPTRQHAKTPTRQNPNTPKRQNAPTPPPQNAPRPHFRMGRTAPVHPPGDILPVANERDMKRNLTKINYRIHTDAIQANASQLVCLANFENLNALFINEGQNLVHCLNLPTSTPAP